MRYVAMAEYEVIFDDKYSYIESFEIDSAESKYKGLKNIARHRIRKELIQRGVLVSKIELICLK